MTLSKITTVVRHLMAAHRTSNLWTDAVYRLYEFCGLYVNVYLFESGLYRI